MSARSRIDVFAMPAPDPSALHGWTVLLSDEEQARAARFHHAADRAAWTAAHGLLRLALTHRCPSVAPGAWQFGREPAGRPLVLRQDPLPDLRVSLSHCRAAVACVVAEGLDVGVDVEPLSRVVSAGLIERGATDNERAAWSACEPVERTRRFLRHWTLKEAYLKARGEGLSSAALRSVGFELGPPARLVVAPPWVDEPPAWSFATWLIGDCQVAVAVRSGDARADLACHTLTAADAASASLSASIA